ncbi:hypothetical protein [Microcoleus sp. FACHB-68]|nr:hypothetical protein [Microcoleus sp. FACHB-68]
MNYLFSPTGRGMEAVFQGETSLQASVTQAGVFLAFQKLPADL